MIRIKRAGAPNVLKNAPLKSTRYNMKPVVKALWNMQKEKCCYCEQKIPSEGHAKAVEHFQPKSIVKFRKNDWKNLLLACAQCNGSKSDRFPLELTVDQNEPKVIYLKKNHKEAKGRILLIDPSDPKIDPEVHIDFIIDDAKFEVLGIPFEKNNSKLGRWTIHVIGLDTAFYCGKRRTFFVQTLFPAYNSLLIALNSNDNSNFHNYKDRLRMYMSATNEYAAFARAFCMKKNLDKSPFNIPIPQGYDS